MIVGPVHQPVLIIDTAGPVARQITFQGLRLTYPGERVALDLTEEARYPRRHLPVGGQPVQESPPTRRGRSECFSLLPRQSLEFLHGLHHDGLA
jgi:hypothetical protein